MNDDLDLALGIREYAVVMLKECKENTPKYVLWRDIKQVADSLIERIDNEQIK